jgi:hypothetical protein
VKTFLDRPLLDDLARIHHADDVGDAADDAEVMGDEQHAHAEPRPDLGEQRQDLRLHRDVERGGRLVRDQKSGSLASAIAIMTRWRWPPDN